MKRAATFLGIVLASFSAAQHSHLVCYLAACVPAARDEASVPVCSGHCCQHSHRCQDTTTPEKPQHDQPRNGSCPCPPDCVCHQAPQPLELPKTAAEATEFVCIELMQFDATPVVHVAAPSHSYEWASAVDAATETSVERCAHLCRFII